MVYEICKNNLQVVTLLRLILHLARYLHLNSLTVGDVKIKLTASYSETGLHMKCYICNISSPLIFHWCPLSFWLIKFFNCYPQVKSSSVAFSPGSSGWQTVVVPDSLCPLSQAYGTNIDLWQLFLSNSVHTSVGTVGVFLSCL